MSSGFDLAYGLRSGFGWRQGGHDIVVGALWACQFNPDIAKVLRVTEEGISAEIEGDVYQFSAAEFRRDFYPLSTEESK